MASLKIFNGNTEIFDLASGGSGGGGDINKIESISKNGTHLTIDSSKNVDITVPTKISQLSNDSEYVTNELVESKITEAMTALDIPSNLSDLYNDEGFIDNTVNNLVNYYTKTQSYTKEEINTLIGDLEGLNVVIVESLPTENISLNTIYLTLDTTKTSVYKQNMYIDNQWVVLGTTEVNMSNFYTKDQLSEMFDAKSNIDHTHTELHTHTNMTTVDNVSDIDGKLAYKGVIVGGSYTLPIATTSTLGGVKDDGGLTTSVDSNGVIKVVGIPTITYDEATKTLTITTE